MNVFSRMIFGSRKSRKPRAPGDRLYVVDATGLVHPRHRIGNGQASPRDHAFILKNLVQFASKESIQVKAVFVGRPLREAEEGSTYKGVTVHYVDSPDSRKKKILVLVRKNRRKKDIVVLTADTQIEREVPALGADCMRLSTLKKVLEGRDERERRPRRQAPERSPGRRAAPENKANSHAPENKADNVAGARETAVFNLIDPV